ncbi:DegV family protein [Clostridium sp. Marseille-P299]|uniref:DegV family protein n=1 Tax=Clostridium sp. Marseille-P299 TaxID=1805477 RepID=UPI0008316733|nr:DegV family protein [Clostridium sp. Marseille-P299]
MKQFIISTDSTADLPKDYIQKHNLFIHPLYYTMDDEVYGGSTDLSPEEFYNRMRNGQMPTTMASNPGFINNAFTKQIEDGFDILHISFSSALSCSYSNASVAAKEICDENPDAKIVVIDSLCASMGQGLLVHYALMMKEAGKSFDEIVAWVNENRHHICHQFTVDDLFHLQRGGRVSKTAAVIGTIINVKPVLHVDNEGRLIPLSKTRGRKKALTTLVDNMATKIEGYQNDIIFISHGDCIDDAQFVADLITERFGINNFLINFVSPTIGAHSGPGTVALFFMGSEK